MKKLYRSALVAGVLALGVAACGDDVTIVEPEPTPPPPLSVTLTPSNQTINVGETADFAVGVSGGADGAQASWTCSSSASSVASVATTDSGCRATAASAGNASITVTVTKGNQSSNAGAQVVVTSVSASPATISISSINKGGAPADIESIDGQIDVTLNVDPRDETIERVVLYVDGVEVASQVFAAPMADAAGDDAVAEAMQQITLSFRTDFYSIDEAAGTATPRHLNGDRVISAALEVAGSEADRPSNTVPVRFDNDSGVHVTTDVTTKPSAVSATGELWYGGPDFGTTTINAIPVNYDGGTISAVRLVSFCATSTGQTYPVVDTTAPYSFGRTCVAQEGSATPTFSWVRDGNTENVAPLNNTARFGLSAHPFPVRIDRVGPAGSPDIMANPWIRQNGWINATLDLTGNHAATNATTRNRWLDWGPADADQGIGGYIPQLRIGTTNAETWAATPSQSPELPAPSAGNTTYCVIATAVDLLGNESARPTNTQGSPFVCNAPPAASEQLIASGATAAHVRFGVDIVAPTIEFVDAPGVLEHGERIANATIGQEFQVMVADTGTVGVSGMLAGAPVAGSAVNFNAAGTQNVSLTFAPALPTVSTSNVGARNTPGYLTATLRAQDAAGNQSAQITRSIAFDVAGNTPTMTQALFNTPLSGGSQTFTALASDNFDLWTAEYALTYGAFGTIRLPARTFNDFPPVPGTLINSNADAGITIDNFIRQMELVTGNAPLGVGAQFKPSSLEGEVTDASGQSATATTTILPGAVTDGTSYTAAAATQLIHSWSITDVTTSNDPDDPEVGDVVTYVADAFGPTATFNSPFARVDFFLVVGGELVQIGSGTMGSIFDDGAANGRRHRWTFSWTIPEEVNGVAMAGQNLVVHAIGVNAAGDALASPANNAVTVEP